MKAAAFDYVRPGSVAEALDLLGQAGPDARILAGGQSLCAMLNLRLTAPSVLIDINRLPLGGIEDRGDHIRVGALARHAEVEHATLIARHVPLLTEAMPHVAHVAVRTRGTAGGSLALADPAAEWPTCALALDARLCIEGPRGMRQVPATEFFLSLYQTAVEPDEIITDVMLPKRGADETHVFAELARRHGDYACAGVALVGHWQPGSREEPRSVRAVVFGVGSVPLRFDFDAPALIGNAQEFVQQVQSRLEASGDNHFSADAKRYLVGVLLGRAMATLRQRRREFQDPTPTS